MAINQRRSSRRTRGWRPPHFQVGQRACMHAKPKSLIPTPRRRRRSSRRTRGLRAPRRRPSSSARRSCWSACLVGRPLPPNPAQGSCCSCCTATAVGKCAPGNCKHAMHTWLARRRAAAEETQRGCESWFGRQPTPLACRECPWLQLVWLSCPVPSIDTQLRCACMMSKNTWDAWCCLCSWHDMLAATITPHAEPRT